VSPRVSVIIATYNWSSVLPYSIGSVLQQTMEDFEILVVGDRCTDDSEAVVAAIGDPRIRWINLPANADIHGVTPSFFGYAEPIESNQVTVGMLPFSRAQLLFELFAKANQATKV
jgi:cellulose synthase/poly-beta-1,6-N-acetylglucosamine synthase-like glycosyltransferase